MRQSHRDVGRVFLRSTRFARRVLAGLVVAGGLGIAAAPGCLPDLPSLALPGGEVGEGSCMCAFCLDKPFCMNSTETKTMLDVAGSCSGNANFPLMAVEAAAVQSISAVEGGVAPSVKTGFWCVPPHPSKVVNSAAAGTVSAVACPTDQKKLSTISYVDPCLDVPVGCQSPKADCKTPPMAHAPACNGQYGPQRTACGDDMGDSTEFTGKANAVSAIVNDKCAIYGTSVPTGIVTVAQQRFCFTTCVDNNVLGTGVIGTCNTTKFTDPEVTQSSLLVQIDPSASSAGLSLTVGGSTLTANPALGGRVALDLTEDCWGPLAPGVVHHCKASLPLIGLETTAPFTMSGATVVEASILNINLIEDSAMTAGALSTVLIPSSQPLYLVANVSGNPLGEAFFTPAIPFIGFVDWNARTFDLAGFLADPTDKATLSLTLHGNIPNLPPHADAGGDQTLECTSPAGAPATLSATASTDPDGVADLQSFTWIAKVGADTWVLDGEVVTTPPVTFGATPFGLEVSDTSGLTSLASTTVTVRDTVPPTLSPIDLSTDCVWPPDHKMHLFQLGKEVKASATDTCDPTPFVRIVDVVSNQPVEGGGSGNTAPDVVFGSGAFCVRAEREGTVKTPRVYTVTIEATDAHGNSSKETATIEVPHSEAKKSRCTTGDLAPVVADDDPACKTVALDPHLVPRTDGGILDGSGGAPAATMAGDSGGCSVAPSGGARGRLGALLLGGLAILLAWRRRRCR